MVVEPLPAQPETEAYMAAEIMPVLSQALLKLCELKPEDPVVCRSYFFLTLLFSFIGM
jgi:hypothetical protein